jgi:MFS family permease
VVFAAVFGASVVATFNQTKVPPLIPVLVQALDLSLVEAGLLMSIFSIVGVVLALPAGLLFRRFGPRRTGLVSLGCLVVGSLLGSVAPNGTWLLATRFLEGVSMGATAVLALSTIAAWFPAGVRGVPVAIFSTWIPVGNLAMLLVAPPVYEAWGWRAVWLVGAAAALACWVFYALVVELPASAAESRHTAGASWHEGLLNPGAWLLSVSFAAYQFTRVGLLTWVPTFLVVQAGFGLAGAAQVVSLTQGISVVAGLGTGWLMARIRSRRALYTVGWLLTVPIYALMFQVDAWWFAVLYVLSGIVVAIVPPAVNAATPETAATPREVGPAVGIVAMGRNVGQVISPALLALILQATATWEGMAAALVAGALVGLLSGWLVRVR